MQKQDEILPLECRFLSAEHFDLLHEKFVEAFSDYVIPFRLSKDQFRNHIVVNAVDLDFSIGCFAGDEMVGFSLNGFGEWNGVRTVYDAGTGVVPGFRRRGASRLMFETMMPVFRERGIEQFLLEVITTNEPAVRLYEQLGFQKTRTLLLLEAEAKLVVPQPSNNGLQVREIDLNDIAAFLLHWDGNTSWQNSVAAVQRSRSHKTILGGFEEGECVGYIVFSKPFGRIAQMAVAPDHRKKGIGTALVAEMQKRTDSGHKLQVINLDSALSGAVSFFKGLGFRETIAQFEMVKVL